MKRVRKTEKTSWKLKRRSLRSVEKSSESLGEFAMEEKEQKIGKKSRKKPRRVWHDEGREE